MRKATFRVIHFTKVDRYVAVAWNYDLGVLLSTRDCATYTEARGILDHICFENDVIPQWFDGEYSCAGEGHSLEPLK